MENESSILQKAAINFSFQVNDRVVLSMVCHSMVLVSLNFADISEKMEK